MKQFFPPSFFTNNRERLAKNTTADLIVIIGNARMQKSSDTAFTFTQDSNFWYLTGCDETEATLVIDQKKSESYIILSKNNDYSAVFDSHLSAKSIKQYSSVDEVFEFDIGWKKLISSLKKTPIIASCQAADDYIEAYGMYANPARRKLLIKLAEYLPDKHEIEDVRKILANLRAIKQPQEIEAISQAINASIKAFEEIKKGHYSYEYEIEAQLHKGFRSYGHGAAYEPIVASAENACVLHYIQNQSKIKDGDLILVDAAAKFNHYAADITRMFYSGQPSKRQSDIFKAVQTVQQQIFTLTKPGILFKDFLASADNLVGEQLISLGLIKNNDRETVRRYYPHSTSHFLGIDVHDAGDYDCELQPGMVLTVEPGIYIPKEKIGVRLEDDILITKNGYQNLSSKLSTDLIQI